MAARAAEAAATAAVAALREEEDDDAKAPPMVLWPDGTKSGAPAVTVLPRLARRLKKQQEEGVRFLWCACFGARRADFPKRREHGAVLAHSMGLGKTLTVITFLHTALCRARTEKGDYFVQMGKAEVQNSKYSLV